MEHLTLHTDDGHTLAARCYRPADAAVVVQRVVILAPALGVPQTFYERYARWLSGHGCVVYTVDWRGIGASAPADLRRYRAKLIDWPLHDAPAIMQCAVSRHPGLPISWFGHSMGGILYGLMPKLPQIDHVVTLGSGSGHVSQLARPLLLLAGGTGLAPFTAMLEKIAEQGSEHPLHLIYGVTNDFDLVELDRLQALAARIPNFTFSACVANPESRHPLKGYVTQHIEPRHLNGGDVDVYLCGPPPMVEAVSQFIREQGIAPANFYYEKFAASA